MPFPHFSSRILATARWDFPNLERNWLLFVCRRFSRSFINQNETNFSPEAFRFLFWLGREAGHSFHFVPRLGIQESIPLLPHTSSWRVAEGNFTLHEPFFLIGIVGGGVQLGPLGTAATNGLLCQPRVIMMMEKLVE
jgi:hypothetical protein